MITNLCIFEDDHFQSLHPLSLTRPVFDLRCGMTSLREKIAQRFSGLSLYLSCRDYLAGQLRETNPEAFVNERPGSRSLVVNGRFMFDGDLPAITGADAIWKNRGKVVAAVLSENRIANLPAAGGGFSLPAGLEAAEYHEVSGTWIEYPWDLVHNNSREIAKDFVTQNRGGQILGKLYPGVTLLNEEMIHVAAGAKIKPGVVLDAEAGPIYVDREATILPNAVLEGPVYVGANSIIKAGAKIYEGTSIGAVCKVGGEVEESIIHGHSNKQHEGFLGHAYLGEWVNIGADSANSDLKNNYGTVKVLIDGKLVDSGSLFVGLFVGDHTKCGINTMFNTGTVVGVMSNVFGAGYSAKFIPSFAWGGIESLATHDLEKAIATARRVMVRRRQDLTQAQELVLRRVYELTAHERNPGQ